MKKQNQHFISSHLAIEPACAAHFHETASSLSEAGCRFMPPTEAPVYSSSLNYYGEHRPAAASSGFFDFVPLMGGVLASWIADASGYGASSAIVMSGLRGFLRNLTEHSSARPNRVVEEVNRAVYHAPGLASGSFYASLFYAQLDPAACRLRYVSAAHEPGFLVRQRTGRVYCLESTGMALGLAMRASYEVRTLPLEAGDTLVAFTSGVTETLNAVQQEFFAREVLKTVLRYPDASAASLAGNILQAAEQFGGDARDSAANRTIVVVRCAGAKAKTKATAEERAEFAMAAA